MSLTVNEVTQLVQLLKKLEPGYLPQEIFYQFCRISVVPVVELVPLRLRDGVVEILCLKREADDPYWPGMYHTPGTVIRSTDRIDSLTDPFGRLFADELQNTPIIGEPKFVMVERYNVARGSGIALVYWVEMDDCEPAIGTYFPYDQLPDYFVSEQSNLINASVNEFKQYKGLSD